MSSGRFSRYAYWDDAIRAIKLISSVIADAVIEGKQGEQLTDAPEATAEVAEEVVENA